MIVNSNAGAKPGIAATARCVWDAGRVLGESVFWCSDEQAVYWVDVKQPAILRFDPACGERSEWPVPEMIGCLAPIAGGGMIAGMASGIYRILLGEAGSLPTMQLMGRPAGHTNCDRFNDGKAHPDGSFWAGTMDDAERATRGQYVRMSPEGTLTHIASPYKVCNGPAFSPDGRIAWLSDSAAGIVHRLDLSVRGARPKPFLRFGAADGSPDGLTTDRDGRVWIAFWDGSRVACYDPDSGDCLLEIPMPVDRPTSCAFGGRDLSTLYVSSARNSEGSISPQAGGALFEIRLTGAVGWPMPAYRSLV